MRGHLELMEMRRKGLKPPAGVVICVGGHQVPAEMSGTGAVDIEVGTDDAVEQLDLRCLIGLRVVVFGDDSSRVEAVAEKAQTAGASGVIGLRYHIDCGLFEEWLYAFKPWTEVVNKWN